jgi:hypothetical protein
MPYPSRKVHEVLPEFEATATPRGQTSEQRRRLREYVAAETSEADRCGNSRN